MLPGISWGQTMSEIESKLGFSEWEGPLEDESHSFSGCMLQRGQIDGFGGDALCFFLDGKLACVQFRLRSDQHPAFDSFFDNQLSDAYGAPRIESTEDLVESMLIWNCFPTAISNMWQVYEIMDHHTYGDMWDARGDALALLLKDDEQSIAIISNKEKTEELWDWFVNLVSAYKLYMEQRRLDLQSALKEAIEDIEREMHQ